MLPADYQPTAGLIVLSLGIILLGGILYALLRQ